VKEFAMAAKKSTTKGTAPVANETANSNNISRLFNENVQLLARSSEVALKAYVEIVKTFTDQRVSQASARLVEQVAEGWKSALIETNRLLRNAYSSLDRQIKTAPATRAGNSRSSTRPGRLRAR
jgi:hypothetical protein